MNRLLNCPRSAVRWCSVGVVLSVAPMALMAGLPDTRFLIREGTRITRVCDATCAPCPFLETDEVSGEFSLGVGLGFEGFSSSPVTQFRLESLLLTARESASPTGAFVVSGGWPDPEVSPVVTNFTLDLLVGDRVVEFSTGFVSAPATLKFRRTLFGQDNCEQYRIDLVAFPVGAAPRGDGNCDFVVNFDDVDAFVLALSSTAAFDAVYPGCDVIQADMDGDGAVTFEDIDPFVAAIIAG